MRGYLRTDKSSGWERRHNPRATLDAAMALSLLFAGLGRRASEPGRSPAWPSVIDGRSGGVRRVP
jgi:hypothetical protein